MSVAVEAKGYPNKVAFMDASKDSIIVASDVGRPLESIGYASLWKRLQSLGS